MNNDELRKKITQQTALEVAKKTGLHYQSVYNFRYGKPVSQRTLGKLEKYAREHLKD